MNKNRQWQALVLRLMEESKRTLHNNQSDGIAIVTCHIAINSEGVPMVWVVRGGKRIEPSRDAARIVSELIGGVE